MQVCLHSPLHYPRAVPIIADESYWWRCPKYNKSHNFPGPACHPWWIYWGSKYPREVHINTITFSSYNNHFPGGFLGKLTLSSTLTRSCTCWCWPLCTRCTRPPSSTSSGCPPPSPASPPSTSRTYTTISVSMIRYHSIYPSSDNKIRNSNVPFASIFT